VAIVDKNGALGRLTGATLELGCGATKAYQDSIGVDIVDSPAVDLLGDVFEVLAAIPDRMVRLITSSHFVEHVADLPLLIEETARVTEGGGEMTVVVPHFSNPFFYSDPTHQVFFGLYSFAYLARSRLFKRSVPTYAQSSAWELVDVHLVFRGEKWTRIGGRICRVIDQVMNSSRRAQEFYERFLTGVISCYEIRYTLLRS